MDLLMTPWYAYSCACVFCSRHEARIVEDTDYARYRRFLQVKQIRGLRIETRGDEDEDFNDPAMNYPSDEPSNLRFYREILAAKHQLCIPSPYEKHSTHCQASNGEGFLAMTMENAVRFILGRPVSWY